MISPCTISRQHLRENRQHLREAKDLRDKLGESTDVNSGSPLAGDMVDLCWPTRLLHLHL